MITVWQCAHCAFTVPDEGATFGEPRVSEGGWHFTVTRRLWELEMFRHWREAHPEELAAVGAALATTITEESMIREMQQASQAALDLLTTQLGSGLHRP